MVDGGDSSAAQYLSRTLDDKAEGMTFHQFVQLIDRVPLPHDNEMKDRFDIGANFLLGDPVPLRFQDVSPYETRAAHGSVDWIRLFCHLISLREQVLASDTVYIFVDDRDMSNLESTKGCIQHWPPAAAWWASRVQLIGPHHERTDVVSIHICEGTGLADVHPTWAGTFVLAGLVALFPTIHFALIDNDCLPLTLMEITELRDLASPHPDLVGTTSLRKAESYKGYAAVETAGDSSYPSKRARVDTGTDALLCQ